MIYLHVFGLGRPELFMAYRSPVFPRTSAPVLSTPSARGCTLQPVASCSSGLFSSRASHRGTRDTPRSPREWLEALDIQNPSLYVDLIGRGHTPAYRFCFAPFTQDSQVVLRALVVHSRSPFNLTDLLSIYGRHPCPSLRERERVTEECGK